MIDAPPAEDPVASTPPSDLDILGSVDLTFHAADLPVPDMEFVSAHLPHDADPVSPSLINFDDPDMADDASPYHPFLEEDLEGVGDEPGIRGDQAA